MLESCWRSWRRWGCCCCCCLDAVVERSTGSKLLTMLLMETQKHKAVDAVVGADKRNTTVGGVVDKLQQPVASRGLSAGANMHGSLLTFATPDA